MTVAVVAAIVRASSRQCLCWVAKAIRCIGEGLCREERTSRALSCRFPVDCLLLIERTI